MSLARGGYIRRPCTGRWEAPNRCEYLAALWQTRSEKKGAAHLRVMPSGGVRGVRRVDGSSVCLVDAQMQREIEAGRWRGQDKGGDANGGAAAGPAAKPVPKPYLSAQYREDAMRTTGELCWDSVGIGTTGQGADAPGCSQLQGSS